MGLPSNLVKVGAFYIVGVIEIYLLVTVHTESRYKAPCYIAGQTILASVQVFNQSMFVETLVNVSYRPCVECLFGPQTVGQSVCEIGASGICESKSCFDGSALAATVLAISGLFPFAFAFFIRLKSTAKRIVEPLRNLS